MDSPETTNVLAAVLRGLKTEYATLALHRGRLGVKQEFPDVCEDSLTFRKNYLAYNLLRKVRDPVLGVVPPTEERLVEEAVSSFLEVEKICQLVNQGQHPGWFVSERNSLAPEAVIHTATRKIHALLGEFDLDEFAGCIDFSNGASTRLPRRRAAVPHKFSGVPHVTRECALLAVNLIWFHEPWRLYCQDRFGRESDPFSWVQVVEGSEYFTVPKTSTSLRGACKEPELNMLCQKAIGSMLRSRLRRVRVDLNDQTRNQELARQGSCTGSLATIDLSSASDSVSLRLLEMLPKSWQDMIMRTRSSKMKLPNGTWHELAKVSSMGNGFTFELESLIFWALASACVDLLEWPDRRIGVYGDDIIVHHVVAPHLISVLSYLGFSTNKEKTFLSGPFRESCGAHYHYGVDVTPFYLRTNLHVLEDKYHFLNSLNAWLHVHNPLTGREHAYVHKQLLKSDEVVFVPPSLGTKCGLLAPSLQAVPNVFFCLRRQQYAFRALLATRKSRRLPTAPGYLSWLLGAIHERLGEVAVPVGGVRAPRFKRGLTSKWDDSDVILPTYVLTL